MSFEKNYFREILEVGVVAFLLAMVVQTFILKPFKIPSGSMKNTLQIGDMIFVNRFAYWFHTPQPGDIVVFKYPENPKQDFIKRVVATAGETLDIKEDAVYVNGKPLHEQYIREVTFEKGLTHFPFRVPEGCIFVMGDNRNNSKDSRFWGPLQLDHIRGKAFLLYWYTKNREAIDIKFNFRNLFRMQLIR